VAPGELAGQSVFLLLLLLAQLGFKVWNDPVQPLNIVISDELLAVVLDPWRSGGKKFPVVPRGGQHGSPFRETCFERWINWHNQQSPMR